MKVVSSSHRVAVALAVVAFSAIGGWLASSSQVLPSADAQEKKSPGPGQASGQKPNILVIWGDDIGLWNISFNSRGMMGYETPNIDRIAREGVSFTDYYGQQSCTAGR